MKTMNEETNNNLEQELDLNQLMIILVMHLGINFYKLLQIFLKKKKEMKILLQDMEEMNLQLFFLNVMKMEHKQLQVESQKELKVKN